MGPDDVWEGAAGEGKAGCFVMRRTSLRTSKISPLGVNHGAGLRGNRRNAPFSRWARPDRHLFRYN
jgi:hypothetical protein